MKDDKQDEIVNRILSGFICGRLNKADAFDLGIELADIIDPIQSTVSSYLED